MYPAAEDQVGETDPGEILTQKHHAVNSLVVHGLGLGTSTAGSTGSVPGRGTKILQARCTAENNNNNKQTKTENLHLAEGAKNKGLSWSTAPSRWVKGIHLLGGGSKDASLEKFKSLEQTPP